MAHPEWPRVFEIATAWRAAADAVIDDVRDQRLDLNQAFARADADAATGRVFAVKVFEVVPGVGKVRARRTMAALGIADDATLAEVTGAHRERISEALLSPAE